MSRSCRRCADGIEKCGLCDERWNKCFECGTNYFLVETECATCSKSIDMHVMSTIIVDTLEVRQIMGIRLAAIRTVFIGLFKAFCGDLE